MAIALERLEAEPVLTTFRQLRVRIGARFPSVASTRCPAS